MNWAGRWSNCIYCGVRLHARGKNAARAVPARTTREHIYPASRGGWLAVPACGDCNSRRGNMSLSAFWRSPRTASRREWAQRTAGWAPWAPAKELVALYKRGKPQRATAGPPAAGFYGWFRN